MISFRLNVFIRTLFLSLKLYTSSQTEQDTEQDTEQVNLKNDFHQTEKLELNTPNLK